MSAPGLGQGVVVASLEEVRGSVVEEVLVLLEMKMVQVDLVEEGVAAMQAFVMMEGQAAL